MQIALHEHVYISVFCSVLFCVKTLGSAFAHETKATSPEPAVSYGVQLF